MFYDKKSSTSCEGESSVPDIIWDDLRYAPMHPHIINVSSDDLSSESGIRSSELTTKDNYPLIPVATAAGLAADFLLWELQPSMARPDALRLFAFSVPVIFSL